MNVDVPRVLHVLAAVLTVLAQSFGKPAGK